MAASDHLNGQQFYHASDFVHKPGAELTPEGAEKATGSRPPFGAMWYSSDASTIGGFGQHIYAVKPHDASYRPITEHQEGPRPGFFYTRGMLEVQHEVDETGQPKKPVDHSVPPWRR